MSPVRLVLHKCLSYAVKLSRIFIKMLLGLGFSLIGIDRYVLRDATVMPS